MLNVNGDLEMDALVMDGKTLASGAVSAVRNLANPIQLARLVMDKVRGDKVLGAKSADKSIETMKWFNANLMTSCFRVAMRV